MQISSTRLIKAANRTWSNYPFINNMRTCIVWPFSAKFKKLKKKLIIKFKFYNLNFSIKRGRHNGNGAPIKGPIRIVGLKKCNILRNFFFKTLNLISFKLYFNFNLLNWIHI